MPVKTAKKYVEFCINLKGEKISKKNNQYCDEAIVLNSKTANNWFSIL